MAAGFYWFFIQRPFTVSLVKLVNHNCLKIQMDKGQMGLSEFILKCIFQVFRSVNFISVVYMWTSCHTKKPLIGSVNYLSLYLFLATNTVTLPQFSNLLRTVVKKA